MKAVLGGCYTSRQRGFLLLLIIPLSLGSLNNSQSNALVLGLLLSAVAAGTKRRFGVSSGLVALTCLFKVYPIAVGLLMGLHYGRRFILALVLWLVVGLAIPFALQDSAYVTQQYSGWLHHLRTDERQGLPLELWYRDLRLLCHVCHVPLTGPIYIAIQLLVASGIAFVCWRASRSGLGNRQVSIMILALGTCWMTLFGSATESCTYILLAPSLAWALLDAWIGESRRFVRWTLSASFALFTFTQAAVWFPGGKSLHALGLHPLAASLFFVAIIASLCSTAAKTESVMARPLRPLHAA
jgi:hypothetical protein